MQPMVGCLGVGCGSQAVISGQELRSDAMTQNSMRRLHFAVGILTVIAFIASGAYMMFVANVNALPPGPHLLYISRHIYMLGPALVNLLLSVYVRPVAHPRVPRLQWAGTIFLVIASILLVLAFLLEPMANRGRTVVSALGIFTLWAGTILHVIAPRLGRMLRT